MPAGEQMLLAFKDMRLIVIILAVAFQAFSNGEITLEEAKGSGMHETLQKYIQDNPVIADICVFEQKWIPPSKSFPKGQLVQRAVITHVHCGSAKVGDYIEYLYYIEEAPRFLGEFTSTVRGELLTIFFDPAEAAKPVNGVLMLGSAHWGFSRVNDVFAELFAIELKSNPKLKPEAKP